MRKLDPMQKAHLPILSSISTEAMSFRTLLGPDFFHGRFDQA